MLGTSRREELMIQFIEMYRSFSAVWQVNLVPSGALLCIARLSYKPHRVSGAMAFVNFRASTVCPITKERTSAGSLHLLFMAFVMAVFALFIN
jgi:hypothetical protein